MGIKASGGIRDLKTTLDMIEAGATKIGTSAGVQIMEADSLNFESPQTRSKEK